MLAGGLLGQLRSPIMDHQVPSQATDTTPEVLAVQYEAYRRMTPQAKLRMVFETYETGRNLAMAGIRQRNPQADDEELWRLWARQHLGAELFEEAYEVLSRE
jgi:hypothetical protein